MIRNIITVDLEKRNILHKLRKDLGAYFFAKRAKKNLSLKQLSLETGMREKRIDRLEIGRSKFDPSAMMRLLRKYDVKIYIIFCSGKKLNLN